MININRDTVTVYRKEEREDGTYSMPVVEYNYKFKIFGVTLLKRKLSDDVSLVEEYKAETKRKAGF